MGFHGEDELHSTTVTPSKFKLSRQIFTDSNTSVPRKLRSAIRKRSCESASVLLPDRKRSNDRLNGVDLLSKDCLRKPKTSMQNGWSDHSPRHVVSAAISKDEEEVAETLFALAGMIPLDGVNVNNNMDNGSGLCKKQHSECPLSSEDPLIPKGEPELYTFEPTDSSAKEPLQASSVIDSASPVWPKVSERRQLNLNLNIYVPLAQYQIPPLLRACEDRHLTNSTLFCGSAEQNRECRLKDTKHEKPQVPKRESDINIGVADLVASQDREHGTSTECRDNVLATRPLHGCGVDGLPVQSSAILCPSWLNNTSSSKSGSCKDTFSAGKIPCSINGGRKSWRRCVAHVYISRLIQVLQTSEGKDIRPLDTNQLRQLQCSSTGHMAGKLVDLNGSLTAGQMFGSAAHNNISETANDVPLHKHCHVKEEGPSVSGFCDSKEQGYNFLFLSTGASPEVNNDINRLGITLEAKCHVLQLHSVGQHNTCVPSSMQQNCFSSMHYRDQVAVVSAEPPFMSPKVQLQVPHFSNPSGPAHMDRTRSKQQPQPKQQQPIWTSQIAAQFRPGSLLSSHIANWQNSIRDPCSMSHMQTHLPPPQPSLETIGSQYLHFSQQPQQQLFGLCPSLPMSSAKLQSSQPPSIYEDKGGRFHADGVLPLHLLCNERLLS